MGRDSSGMVAYHLAEPHFSGHEEASVRHLLLWAAKNRWLKERLPRMRFVRRAVRRFMPGETLADALGAAIPLQAAGIRTLYTHLGENLANLGEADEVA